MVDFHSFIPELSFNYDGAFVGEVLELQPAPAHSSFRIFSQRHSCLGAAYTRNASFAGMMG